VNANPLPHRHAQHFNISSNATDFILAVGDTRMIPLEKGLAFAIEWLETISMSPVAAKMLLETLQESVARYEAVAGPIVSLPAAVVSTATGESLAGANVTGLFAAKEPEV